MSRTTPTISCLLLMILIFNVIEPVQSVDLGNLAERFSRTANRLKLQLLEFFYRFRAFFVGHSESTHHQMTSRGCGFAIDDEPKIYNEKSKIRSKIRGGDTALWHTWPWMVGLFKSSGQPWHCAGVLVNENTVLTAAHCLTDESVSEMKAIIGVHTILGKLNPLNYYSIKSIHRHPDYKSCCKNDLAILKLTEPVLYGPKINAVCLPFQEQFSVSDETKLINRTGVIIGWGDSSDDGLTNFINSFSLKQADIRIFDNEICHQFYPTDFDPKTEICAGDYDQQANTMSGDSGGPLLIRQTDGRWIVLGITSYGASDALGTAPGVYSKVSAYHEWLSSYL